MCRHPLNCEPPLSMLMGKGFITPVSLHYVRNHGAVPKLDWDTHKVKVCICHEPQCLAALSHNYCSHHMKIALSMLGPDLRRRLLSAP